MITKAPISKIPFLGQLIKNIDKDIETFGIQQALKNILQATNTRLEIKGMDESLEEILKKEAVLVISNHNFEAEIIALFAALPQRRDSYLIIHSLFTNISSNLDRHFIPVYISHHTGKKTRVLIDEVVYIIHPSLRFSPEESRAKNIKSIKLASEKLKHGQLIAIIPAVRGTKKWYPGVGFMLKGVGRQKDIAIVKTYVSGTTPFDFLRLLPFVGNFFPAVTIFFAKPLSSKKIYSDNPKEIVEKLRKDYFKWVQSLHNFRD